MDGAAVPGDDQHDPPSRLFERLRQIAGYTWDEKSLPWHLSYNSWHVSGTRFVSPHSASISSHSASSPGSASRTHSGRHSPSDAARTTSEGTDATSRSQHPRPASLTPSASNEVQFIEEPVIARLSYHVIREERLFQVAKTLISTTDPDGNHALKPIDLFRLQPAPGDRGLIVVSIWQNPGHNHLMDILDMGPANYRAQRMGDTFVAGPKHAGDEKIGLDRFLEFAIGAAQCLEILHHGLGMIHGEIRGDAFHYNADEGKVRIASFGSGMRSFEHGLTSAGWSSLSKEVGAKNKLLYISPEQTGRMPTEPDSRTDIYSLGVLLWMLLAQRPVFEGDSPLDIVQGVLGRRIPNVSTIRLDIPETIGKIIQKCTAKNITDRYHSASGLRTDLVQVQKFLSDGDAEAVNNMTIASKDVSSFFMLPSAMIGRQKEKAEIMKVIDRVAKSHAMNRKSQTNRFSDGSNLSSDVVVFDDVSSEGGSSAGADRRSGSFSQAVDQAMTIRHSGYHSTLSDAYTISNDTVSSSQSVMTSRMPKPWERHQSLSVDNRSVVDSIGTDNRHSLAESTTTSLSRQLGSAKFRRRGHCEVITVEGAGGLGKSCLVQSVLADARRRGYCATAKFDTARRTAFGPLLKLLSSLFKQVWGERNTETPFHQMLKQYVRPVWPMLHRVLNLPEFLLGPSEVSPGRSLSSMHSMHSGSSGSTLPSRPTSKSLKGRRESSPGISPGGRRNSAVPPQSSQEFLRSGSSTKTTRLMNVFLDVLRVFTQHKFICFCLDDLHFAEDESIELISQIVGTRMKMVVIMTYRPEELTSERMQNLLVPTDPDEPARASGPLVTRISLAPLTESDIIEYVGATLCRPGEEVLPLALVIQSKSAGNPFFLREMLSACHRKRCIWYDYHNSQWLYDLDRLFEQFRGEKDYDVLDTAFITQRLSELPPAARALLSWSALLGSTFSFELVARLMSGEFEYDASEYKTCCATSVSPKGWTEGEAILGLQAAIQAYIIVPADTDDRFRMTHDRYLHAAAALEECSAKPMHFIIAQTMLKYYNSDEERQRDSASNHICEAVDIIKRRQTNRRVYRKHLAACGQSATERGARPTAAKLYRTAIQLLQDDPWTDGLPDVSYEETLTLFLRNAECYLYLGQHELATECLGIIFDNAKTVLDKAPAYVLQSRIYAQCGDSEAALVALKECLSALDVAIDDEPTWKKCDEKFEKLSVQLQTTDRSVSQASGLDTDPTLASIGAILSETVTAALWSDSLRFYHLTIVMIEMHLSRGFFPHSGMAFLYLAIVSVSRFGMAQFAISLGAEAQALISKGKDTFSLSQDLMLHACFIGHLSSPMPKLLIEMEDAVEFASTAGDRMNIILSYGLFCQYKLFASDNIADIEAFCQFGCCEEIPDWDHDVRGGPILLAVRQVCRALQGKTYAQDPLGVLSDPQHDSESYKTWLSSLMHHSGRSTLLYESLELVPLFLYGHYDRAIELGDNAIEKLEMLWSARNSRLVLLFHGLALSGKLLRQMQDPVSPLQDAQARTDEIIQKLKGYIKLIDDWNSASNINYLCWSRLLKAQVAELGQDHGVAVECYEEALDHATEHDFIFEEALSNYSMAGFFLRRKARRSARAALADAVGSYRLMGATGVAKAIEEEHSLLLHGPTRSHRTVDVAIQTEFTADATTVPYRAVDGANEPDLSQIRSTDNLSDQRGDRIGAWRGSMNLQTETGVSLPELDMLDLHAILVSSQVISSVLNVDDLLKTMCDNILQTCGGSANLAAIVVQDDSDTETWCVAASGDPERGASAHRPGLSLAGTSLIVENVVLYCTRFRETVLVPDLISDERFGNVSDSWLQRNPLGKAVIAIPISHGKDSMYGVLYLEGQPGSFTDRNVTVLQLLVNQIAISYANALAMKNLEKVSAENRSMVTVQKRALEKAINAEAKAKDAEAEAKRNVKLAEEAAKAKSIFLANVSHELRTPLNGVIGNSELLRDSSLNREQMEMADSIRVSADLLLTVINDILDFSKMEADKMKLYIIAFNPAEMVREVVRAVSYSNREKTSKKNVKIVQDINLPPMLIYGDPIRLHQVLGNLIGNSLKFTEDGSITIGARLDSDTKDAAVLTFWVRDTGIGIPPQQLAKLFQPFSQADASTARKYGGSGLGLSICKSLIQTMMKGKIQLESEEAVGTTAWFTVTFEKTKSDVSAGDAQATASPPIDRFANGPSPLNSVEEISPSSYVDLSNVPQEDIRVCIAEDNPINQKIAIQYVQRLGYHNVDAYDNGMKAVEGLRQKASEGKPYHVILMDVMMPVLDGYEATKLIRKDSNDDVRKVLVIAMTASAIQGDREKCLAAGMNDYLAKPVRSEVLKKKLDAYLGESPGTSEAGHSPSPGPDGISSKPTPANPADHHPETSTVSDPMGENAIYNRPLDATSLASKESPIQDASAAAREPDAAYHHRPPTITSHSSSSRASSENRGRSGEYPRALTSNGFNLNNSASSSSKRLPRKLTKNRGSSETSVERPSHIGPPFMASPQQQQTTPERPSSEKPRGVLTKRVPQRQNTGRSTEDGFQGPPSK